MSGFSSFRTQLLLLVIGLFSLILLAVFIAVNRANENNARQHIDETLNITAVTFQRSLAARNHILRDKARLLSGDFAFKEAVATNDYDTILSVLENHRQRVRASVMMLASLDGKLIADTLHLGRNESKAWSLQSLQKNAENSEEAEANGIQLLDDKPYQLVLMPLFTPEPSAWIVIGFRINDRFSQLLAKQTNSQVSILYKRPVKDLVQDPDNKYNKKTEWQLFSTTIKPTLQKDLVSSIQLMMEQGSSRPNQITDVSLQGEQYLSRTFEVQGSAEGKTLVVLQRSLSKALIPYLRLRDIMLFLFALGLIIAIVSAFAIARNFGRPLEALTRSVKRIEDGDYENPTLLKRSDELGTLSTAIKHMTQGLMERDLVRDLLGKVVSPEIATELLSKDIELGGEERASTILFCDICGFTNLCEGQKPKEILSLLNRYLSSMSNVIEEHHGVIDKYIGDAIMALFGVPINIEKDSEQAVRSAIKMVEALDILNEELMKDGITPIRIGIGINTGQVVAGNMGSPNRLNYTVLGDSVNLAARLEGLTRYFGVSIIVSETTAEQCKSISFRDLGTAQVKGKVENIRIFEPLSFKLIAETEVESLESYHSALECFRKQQWDMAEQQFRDLLLSAKRNDGGKYSVLYQLYLNNIMLLRQQKTDKAWQGELIFSQK